MSRELIDQLSPVLFIPHGAGPLPLLGDKSHEAMVSFLKAIAPTLGQPSAIVVISAHWEASVVTITSAKAPPLFYDYYGFPEAAYDIQYPAPGAPLLAEKIYHLLTQSGIAAKLDSQRGFDHGLFVPLKIMFPDAAIPCVQVSLLNSLNPGAHLKIGAALTELRKQNVLFIGSGFSFHNIKAFFAPAMGVNDSKNEAFEHWLIDTCTNNTISADTRHARLIDWQNAPFAEYCHPREEHLLPLHVCCGLSNLNAKLVFDGEVSGKKACALLWQS
ncbi:MAG: class III extradiol ring-cleavage dioxygenase [Methylococcales bacterium]